MKRWTPGKQARVCSAHFVDNKPTTLNPYPVLNLHFVDNKPTTLNPYPVLNLGYNDSRKINNIIGKSTRRSLHYKNKIETVAVELPAGLPSDTIFPDIPLADFSELPSVSILPTPVDTPVDEATINNFILQLFMSNIISLLLAIQVFSNQLSGFAFVSSYFHHRQAWINILQINLKHALKRNEALSRQIKHLQKLNKKCTCHKPLNENILKTDKNVLFYTGIKSLSVFNKLYNYIVPYVRRKWRGPRFSVTTFKRNFSKSPKKMGPATKLPGKDEFLLMLMKVRLGLLQEDLANRFKVSGTQAGRIFATWVKAARKVMDSLVYVLDQGTVNATKPCRFNIHGSIHSIADGSEIFIQTPKNHDLQRMTWSQYKHHNTGKFLIVVAPNSFIQYISPIYAGSISDKELTKSCGYLDMMEPYSEIMVDKFLIVVAPNSFIQYISPIYAGSISDKELTKSCGYLDMMEPYSEIMVDKGFNISDECTARRIHLCVPPGKKGQSQMLSKDIQKTHKVANMRILVEQVISQLKNFRMLSHEIPINMLVHMDDILQICAAIINMQNPIYK